MKAVRALLTLAVLMSAQAMGANAPAECSDVEVVTITPLHLGTMRVARDAIGFIELHPRTGLAISAPGVSHAGAISAGQLQVRGPAASEIGLRLEVVERSVHEQPQLTLSELIVENQGIEKRLPPEGSLIRVQLPNHADAEGRATQRIEIGAVMRFRWIKGSEQANYQLVAECASVQLR